MNKRPIRIHVVGADSLRPLAVLPGLAGHAGLKLTGTSPVAPDVPRLCQRTRTQVALVLAGPVPLEVLNLITLLRNGRPRVDSVALIEEPADPDRVPALLAAGARGVLAESISVDEIHRAASAVVDGGCVLGPGATEIVLERASWAQQQFLGVPLESLDLEILSMLADGSSGGDVAQRLGIDRGTLHASLRAAKRAFGARTQEAVVAAAIRRGLI